MIRSLRIAMFLYAVRRVVRHPAFWIIVLGALMTWLIGVGVAW